MELNPSTGNIETRYVYVSESHSPDYMIRGGQECQFVKDHLGSVKLVVRVSDGVVMQNITYDEFGRVLSDTNPGFQPFGFAGGVYDAQTGLVKFGVRDYDAEVGRWLTKDPILFHGGDANLYGYVLSDPIDFIDPSGLAFGDWWDPSTYSPKAIKDNAENRTEGMGDNRSSPRRNDTRHCYASCMASKSYGTLLTKLIGDFNENNPDDLAANKCGREISKKAKDYEDCFKRCTQANLSKK